jgi:hypothetical protein
MTEATPLALDGDLSYGIKATRRRRFAPLRPFVFCWRSPPHCSRATQIAAICG